MPTPTEIEKLQGQLLEMAGRINAACTREDQRPTWIHWSDAQVLVAVADKLGHMNNVQSLLTESLGLLGEACSMKPPFYIYGSGDKGTAELCEIFTELQIEFLFRDIRTTDTSGDRVWLRYLARQGHPTVPQVYYPNGVYLGDHDATLAYLQLHPDGWQQQAVVVA